ncbi:MAG: hypothetical protein JSS65_14285, partial [Armatimonadetes bacterium]|nr:hypothetical protein [Armatimonadota bacterium]
HKAKGLEFGHVFLPDMHLQSPRESRALVDASTGTVVFGAKDSALAAYLTAESRRRNQQELRRVFYVGITRAKSKAYVTLQTGKQHGLTGELAQVLGVPGRTWPGVVLVGGPGE